jgi:hypothetical protein
MKRKIALVLGGLLVELWMVFSWPTYHYPTAPELRQKAHYLERIIRTPERESAEMSALGNAEWSLFSLSYAVYAFTNMAQLDSTFRRESARYTQMAIAKMLNGNIRQSFHNPDATIPADSLTSVLYLGHLNLMLGCHRLLDPASPYRALHDSLSASLHRRLAAAPNHCLEFYPGGVWAPDNTVALASLHLHSDQTGSPYRAFCRQWVAYARQHLTDPATGLLLSKPATRHQAAEEPRGSHLG